MLEMVSHLIQERMLGHIFLDVSSVLVRGFAHSRRRFLGGGGMFIAEECMKYRIKKRITTPVIRIRESICIDLSVCSSVFV